MVSNKFNDIEYYNIINKNLTLAHNIFINYLFTQIYLART